MADDAAEQAFVAAVEEIAQVKAGGHTSLHLSGEAFHALASIPPELGSLTKLMRLDLHETQVSDLAPLASLTDLEWLNLENTQVSDLTPLASLTNLEVLYLANTQVSDLTPLASLTNLEELYLANTKVSDLAPLAGLTDLTTLNLDNTQVGDLTPLASLTNLQTLWLTNTPITNLTPVAGLKKLRRLDLNITPITDLALLAGLANLVFLNLDDTNAIDLRPLTGLARLGHLSAFQPNAFQENAFQIVRFSFSFKNTPATARDGHLAQLAKIEDDEERTRKTLEYLRSLPPWPEPYTPEYTPDGSPPQPIGGEAEAEADEVLVPAPVRAPLEVEVVDGRLRSARPGDGLGADAHEHARQAWQALRDFLADLADIRPRIVNQMPQLERALTRLEDALGADYEAANPIAMGINGNRVIAQAGAAGETMADADAAELREFAAALSLFLERFPAWRAYRGETAPAPPAAPRIEEAIPEIEAITEELREHEAIDPAIPESLEKQAGDVRSNPEDSLAKRGLVDSLNNVLSRIGEAILTGGTWVADPVKNFLGKNRNAVIAGGRWALGEIVDVGGQYYRTVKSLTVKGAAGITAAEISLFSKDLFAALAPRLHALATALPEKFGWLKNFLALLGLA